MILDEFVNEKQFKELKQQLNDFSKHKKNADNSIHLLIKWFCISNGYSNDYLHSHILYNTPKYSSENHRFGVISQKKIDEALTSLRTFGYFNFGTVITKDTIACINDSFNHIKCKQIRKGIVNECLHLPKGTKGLDRIFFEEDQLLKSSAILDLISDKSILYLASQYLGCTPILSNIASWISFYNPEVNHSEAAQLFHFDMDRIKWVKFFIYLNDVDEKNGPHCVVKKTHLSGSHPKEIRKRGYARISDKKISKFFPSEDIIEFVGEAGTLIAVDTRAYHKGKILKNGSRRIFQMEFADSLFGGQFEKINGKSLLVPFKTKNIENFNHIYQKYL